MTRITTSLTLILGASLLAGCGVVGHKKAKTPVVGERTDVLVSEAEIAVDPITATLPFALPDPAANADWAQPGGEPDKAIGHVALGNALAHVWTVSIGKGSGPAGRLGGGPVVSGGKLFTVDTQGLVRAMDARNGGTIWTQRFGTVGRNASSLYGGGVSADGDKVYATNGLGYVACLDAATGKQVWVVRPGGPLRGAPSVDGSNRYGMSQDNQVYSLKEADGTTNWSNAAALEIAGVFGTGAPAVARGTVIAGFSSGELNAYRYENGRMVWQDTLQRTSISTSVSSLSDIDAAPVIDNGVVYSIGAGGRMVALDINSGQRLWELSIAGLSTPAVAGDWIFVVTDKAQLLAIAKASGKIRWINQLPRYRKMKAKANQINYQGPVLAGGRLILAGSNGVLVNVNPDSGSFQSQTNIGSGVSFQPVVAGGTLYLLEDSGRLTAYR